MNKYLLKNFHTASLLTVLLLSFGACQEILEEPTALKEEEHRRKIELVTEYGTIVLELYNETPLHRDNFINLASNKAYDSLLFHRVIATFMIQGGDPESKNATPNDTLGDGDAPYVVEAEFNPKLFHKKGALGAARDNNPEKASSGMQFYIIQGKVYNDSLLERSEKRINQWNAQDHYKNIAEKKPLLDAINDAMNNGNTEGYNQLMAQLEALASSDTSFKPYRIPEQHRTVYKSIGGTPHLDQNYTVFGEVIEGIEVLDAIAIAKTDPLDRPATDIRIKTVRILD